MTDPERNELVEKLAACFLALNPEEEESAKYSSKWYVNQIESLGYEIVKKEHLKELTDAFVLQQVRAGNFTRRELTEQERAAMQINAFGLPAKPEL